MYFLAAFKCSLRISLNLSCAFAFGFDFVGALLAVAFQAFGANAFACGFCDVDELTLDFFTGPDGRPPWFDGCDGGADVADDFLLPLLCNVDIMQMKCETLQTRPSILYCTVYFDALMLTLSVNG